MAMRFSQYGVCDIGRSGRQAVRLTGAFATVSHLGDDLSFITSLTIYNAIIGTRFLVVDSADVTSVLASGLITDNPHVIPAVTATRNPMTVEIRLRNASGSPKYLPYTAQARITRNPSEVFVQQIVDTIAQ